MKCKTLAGETIFKKGDITFYNHHHPSLVLIMDDRYIRIDDCGFLTHEIPSQTIQDFWLLNESWFRKV